MRKNRALTRLRSRARAAGSSADCLQRLTNETHRPPVTHQPLGNARLTSSRSGRHLSDLSDSSEIYHTPVSISPRSGGTVVRAGRGHHGLPLGDLLRLNHLDSILEPFQKV